MIEGYVRKEANTQETGNHDTYHAGSASQCDHGEGGTSTECGLPNHAASGHPSHTGGMHGHTDHGILPANHSSQHPCNIHATHGVHQHLELVGNDMFSIQGLKAIPGNSKCFDCAVEDPQWVNVNYAIILCADCADIHLEHGLNIVPFADGYLTEEYRSLLAQTGNRIASYYWMANWTPENPKHVREGCSKEERRQFIIAKYCGEWVSPTEKAKLVSAINHVFYASSGGQCPQDTPHDFATVCPVPAAKADQSPQQVLDQYHQRSREEGMPGYVISNMTFRPRKLSRKNPHRR